MRVARDGWCCPPDPPQIPDGSYALARSVGRLTRSRHGVRACANSVRHGAVALEFSRLELPARSCDETDGLVGADLAGVDLAIRQDHHDARSDAYRNDARRRGARAVERPALEHFEIGG